MNGAGPNFSSAGSTTRFISFHLGRPLPCSTLAFGKRRVHVASLHAIRKGAFPRESCQVSRREGHRDKMGTPLLRASRHALGCPLGRSDAPVKTNHHPPRLTPRAA